MKKWTLSLIILITFLFAIGRFFVPTRPNPTLAMSYEAFAHIWVGGLIGAWLVGRRREFLYAALIISAVELGAFLVGRTHAAPAPIHPLAGEWEMHEYGKLNLRVQFKPDGTVASYYPGIPDTDVQWTYSYYQFDRRTGRFQIETTEIVSGEFYHHWCLEGVINTRTGEGTYQISRDDSPRPMVYKIKRLEAK